MKDSGQAGDGPAQAVAEPPGYEGAHWVGVSGGHTLSDGLTPEAERSTEGEGRVGMSVVV